MYQRFRAAVGACIASAVIGLAVLAPGYASAQTTTVSVSGPDASQSGVGYGNIVGQIVTVPAGVTTLNSFSLRAAGGATPSTVRPAIYVWDGADVGAQLFGAAAPSQVVAPFAYQTLTFAVGLAVSPGQQIVIAAPVENAGEVYNLVLVTTDSYAGGSRVVKLGAAPASPNPTQDYVFSAVFQNATPVPTMSEWALILLGVMLAGGAALTIQRRRTA
ncbi:MULTISPECIES: IPTL-CTERM sorting domain-containing protein [unclassified Brevundimonas]|uniref:IPTL-CTERM sorting domain-containing protein n=1 Tax=unclassified Brevundimonas TaxID=2622653 RepID=UPI003F937D04